MARIHESNVLILDCGASMRTKSSSTEKSRFDASKEFIQIYLQQKILLSPKDEVSVILFGCDETNNEMNEDQGGYDNIAVMSELQQPVLQLIRDIQKLESSDQSADCFDAIVVATDYLEKRSQKNKTGPKRCFLFTDGGCVEFSEARDKSTSIAVCMKELGHEPVVVWIDDDQDLSPIRQKTKQLLQIFCEDSGGIFLPREAALVNLQAQRHKTVQQTTKTRVNLIISNEIQIPVWSFLKIKEEALPSLKSMSALKGGAVRMNRTYVRLEDDADGSAGCEVPKEDRVRAFLYGKDLVPVTETDIGFLKFDGGDKSLKVIGSLRKSDIPQSLLTEKTECISADPTCKATRQGLSDFIDALHSLDFNLIARYVWRKPYPPKLVLLTPNRKRGCLYLNYLPFSEDIRDLTFKSLPKISLEQKQVMSELIDVMNLMRPTSVEEQEEGAAPIHELYKPNSTYNPTLQKFYRLIVAKALDPEASVFSIKTSDLDEQIDVDERVQNDALAQLLKDNFILQPVAAEVRTKKRFWKDVFGDKEQSLKRVSLQTIDVDEEKDVETVSKSAVVEKMKVGTINSANDFLKMIEMKDADLTLEAFDQLDAVVRRLVTEGGITFFSRALSYIQTMRAAGISECGSAERSVILFGVCTPPFTIRFNRFLREFRDLCSNAYRPMWKSLESAGVTLISNEESTDSNTTVEEAKQSAIILDDVLRISVLRFLASSELPSNSPQVQTTVQVQDDEELLHLLE